MWERRKRSGRGPPMIGWSILMTGVVGGVFKYIRKNVNGMKYFIYLEKNKDRKTGEPYVTRRYYQKKINVVPDYLSFVGEAELSEDYFIVGCETHYADIDSLNMVEVEYTARLTNGRIAKFKHTIQELLERAKEGELPYISFKEFKVSRKIKVILKGPKPLINIDYDRDIY